MRILVVGNRVPWPQNDGGAIATFQMLKALSFEGVHIDYFTYNTKKHHVSNEVLKQRFSFCRVFTYELVASLSPVSGILNLFSSRSYFLQRYQNKEANDKITGLLQQNQYDIVHIEGLYSSPFYHTIRSFFGGPIVYRAHNVEFQIWERLGQQTTSPLKKIYLKIQVSRLKREELRFIKKVDAICAISQNDLHYFQKQTSINTFLYTPGMVTGLQTKVQIQPNRLFHIGSMEWDANVEGVQWFLIKVWPNLKAKFPKLEFHIAGKGLNKTDSRYFQTDVFNHGEVENAKEFMLNHGICIVPIWAGSGIRMKMIESMSYGIPVVSTKIGAQGIHVINRKQAMVADSASEFIVALSEILSDPQKSVEIGQEGRLFTEEHFNLQRNTQKMLSFYDKLIKEKNEIII